VKTEIGYGKAEVSTYRTYGTPLRGLTAIPESAFTGRENTLLAAEIDVQVLGEAFLAAYTEGDNSLVVATDTMKNFIHRESLAFEGSTLEGWLLFIGRRFLETYPDMERLKLDGRELTFEPVRVPAAESGAGFADSSVLFHRRRDDRGAASIALDRSGSGGAVRVTDLSSSRAGLQLIKITGSAFKSFARDDYTTLPERVDRPLHIYVEVGWRYGEPAIATEPDVARYVATEQVRDLVGAVFDRFVSLSIQHLVNEIGNVMLERWPQLSEVSFVAQNRLWDVSNIADRDERIKVYTDPRPPYGRITLRLARD
jgi:urate oxidase